MEATKAISIISQFKYANTALYLIRCGFHFSEYEYCVKAEIETPTKGTFKAQSVMFRSNDDYREQKAERTFFETVAMYGKNVQLFDALQAAFEESKYQDFKNTDAELVDMEG